ncbi:MAG: hypothetical protein MOB07_12835 [Acidobacteria bacterium]|nr:hypothetical protein [Acidobacteriota bacterium]
MMAVAGNALYGLLTSLQWASNKAVIRIGIIPLLMIGGAVVALKHYVDQFQAAPALSGKRPPALRKGLILMVSEIETCCKAIDWRREKVRHCW